MAFEVDAENKFGRFVTEFFMEEGAVEVVTPILEQNTFGNYWHEHASFDWQIAVVVGDCAKKIWDNILLSD